MGNKRLDHITDEVVAELRARWVAGGYTYTTDRGQVREVKPTSRRKTINNRLSVLSMILKCAYDWKRIAAVSCRIRLLRVDDQAEAEHYDHETYERLVSASATLDPRLHAAVLLGGEGGLRRGEMLGLNLDDVDFRAGRMAIRRSVYSHARLDCSRR